MIQPLIAPRSRGLSECFCSDAFLHVLVTEGWLCGWVGECEGVKIRGYRGCRRMRGSVNGCGWSG